MLNIKTRIILSTTALVAAFFISVLLPLQPAYAQSTEAECADAFLPDDPDGYNLCVINITPGSGTGTPASTGGVNVDCTADASGSFDECFSGGLDTLGAGQNPIATNLLRIINFLSIGIGVVITVSVVAAAIQWTASGGEPQKRAKAISRIWNAAIALIIFVFGWALINWLIPGGLLSGSTDTGSQTPTCENGPPC